MNIILFGKALLGNGLNVRVNPSASATAMSQSIQLKPFVDFELDIAGWYALGHHNPQKFFAAVVERDPVNLFQRRYVKRGWAKLDGNHFEFVTRPLPGSQAVTVIESLT